MPGLVLAVKCGFWCCKVSGGPGVVALERSPAWQQHLRLPSPPAPRRAGPHRPDRPGEQSAALQQCERSLLPWRSCSQHSGKEEQLPGADGCFPMWVLHPLRHIPPGQQAWPRAFTLGEVRNYSVEDLCLKEKGLIINFLVIR